MKIKAAYFQTMIFTKSISTCDERKMAKEMLLKEIDLMIFFGQKLNLANSAYSFVNSAGINWLVQVHKQPWSVTDL